jgi:hypothetical protein
LPTTHQLQKYGKIRAKKKPKKNTNSYTKKSSFVILGKVRFPSQIFNFLLKKNIKQNFQTKLKLRLSQKLNSCPQFINSSTLDY